MKQEPASTCVHDWKSMENSQVPAHVKKAIADQSVGFGSFATLVSQCTKCGQYGFQRGYSVSDIGSHVKMEFI